MLVRKDVVMPARHSIAMAAIIVAGAIGLAGEAGWSGVSRAAAPVSFREDVLPVFIGRCTSCHSAPNGEGYLASGLDLTSYRGLMAGTRYGPMVIPGDPDASNLMRLLDWKASPALRMPHGHQQLTSCDRIAIRDWIHQGAKDN
jgi:hypothetical protein